MSLVSKRMRYLANLQGFQNNKLIQIAKHSKHSTKTTIDIFNHMTQNKIFNGIYLYMQHNPISKSFSVKQYKGFIALQRGPLEQGI